MRLKLYRAFLRGSDRTRETLSQPKMNEVIILIVTNTFNTTHEI
jgi:hypothetical protein